MAELSSITRGRQGLKVANLQKLFCVVTLNSFLLFSFVYWLDPDAHGFLLDEHSFIENVSALLFFEGFFLGFLFLFTRRAPKIYALLPIASFLGFMSELSLIEVAAAMGRETPTVVGGSVDAPHDLFQIFFWNVLQRHLSPLVVAILGVMIVAIAAYLMWRFRARIPAFLAWWNRYPALHWLLVATVTVFFAMVVDAEILSVYFGIGREGTLMYFLEELLEMQAGLTLVFGSFAIKQN